MTIIVITGMTAETGSITDIIVIVITITTTTTDITIDHGGTGVAQGIDVIAMIAMIEGTIITIITIVVPALASNSDSEIDW